MARLIFIDSADISEIKKWKERISCAGVTTNQKHISAQKNNDFKKIVLAICNLVKVPVSVELTTHDSVSSMVKEAKIYTKWHKNVVIKVPMTLDGMGLEVIRKLTKLQIKTNATLMVSFEQMLLAINSGATYASILFNRAKDEGYDECEIIRRSRNFIDKGGYKSLIITGSVRNIRDVGDAFENGSDIVTIPPNVLDAMLIEKGTQKLNDEMDAAWEKFITK